MVARTMARPAHRAPALGVTSKSPGAGMAGSARKVAVLGEMYEAVGDPERASEAYRKALDAAAAVEAAVLGISTSSFRISVLVEERHLAELTRGFHAALVEDD